MKSRVLVLALLGLTAAACDSSSEPPIADPRCSASRPTGTCDDGLTCRAGECLADQLFCSAARPSGLCAVTTHACVDGACVPAAELCSATRPMGLCSGALQCLDGACSTANPCAPTEPQGFCPRGQTCVSGACMTSSSVCSPANPTGACSGADTCVSGVCTPPASGACSPANPTGTCSGADTCVRGVCTPPAGGACSATNPTGSCASGQQCQGGTCVSTGAPAACGDGARNNLETDVDCGGPRCAPCGQGAMCSAATDCRTLACNVTCQPGTPRSQQDEDFETGDLSRFAYAVASSSVVPHHFEVVEAADCHGGRYCLRNSVFQEGGETASITLPLSVRANDMIRFWVKTDLEDNQHTFRFLIDGVEKATLTGQHGWQRIEVAVGATGPGGDDRRLTWEYARSAFVHPDHPPRTTVWIDDLDLPSFNTQPSIPALLSPGNGMVITDDRPELRWRSTDPDFDRIIYEVQVDTDPDFGMPFTTGETFQLTHRLATALVDGTAYYWRARSKDESDYRWSAWSPVASFRVHKTDDYGQRWRQATAAEFRLSQLDGLGLDGDALFVDDVPFTVAVNANTTQYETTVQFDNLPPARANATGYVTYAGAIQAVRNCENCAQTSYMYLGMELDGMAAFGNLDLGSHATCNCVQERGGGMIREIAPLVSDGHLSIRITARYTNSCGSTSIYLCGGANVQLSYPSATAGTITSVPIYLDTFGGAPNWEKVAFHGEGDVRVQVLDERRVPIPDAEIPGNSAGLERGTHMLFGLAPGRAVIYLRAALDTNARLTDWEVYANDGYRFHFGTDGDAEGWAVELDGAEAISEVRGGVLRIDAPIEGRDPRLTYRAPLDLDAARFRELVVRLKTSNNSADDRISMSWENNFGLVDPVRSFVATDFLFDFQDVGFDLRQTPPMGQQPWQGRVRAIRVDPVERFFDAASMDAAGWTEIDSIWLR